MSKRAVTVSVDLGFAERQDAFSAGGVNIFGLDLLVESLFDEGRPCAGYRGVLICGQTHQGKVVWVICTTETPGLAPPTDDRTPADRAAEEECQRAALAAQGYADHLERGAEQQDGEEVE